jgi:hypothetical protein
MRTGTILAFIAFATAIFADTKVKIEDLPAAVQSIVWEQMKSATLIGLSTELEKGKTTYEIETRVNGKGRDVVVDKAGAVLEVEEEVDLAAIPAAAREALRKRAAGGTLMKVETLTQGSKVSYEAAIKTKAGKSIEAGINADGTPHRD